MKMNPFHPLFRFTPWPSSGISSLSVATANGFAGTSSGGTTPILTLTTSVTGLLQGNGTAISGITNSSTVGQVLRVTGASTYAWGALDLTDGDAITGALGAANGGTGVSSLATGMATWFASGTASDFRGIVAATGTAGSVVFSGSPTITSPDITTSLTTGSTTFALINTTATTVNFAGAATTLNIGANATCILNFGGGATASEFRFLEPSGSGTNYSAFKAVAQAASITYSLPPAVGAAGTYLKDAAGDGVLSWATAGGGATNLLKTADETVNNTTTLQSDDTFTFTATANKTYKISLGLIIIGGQAADFKYRWSLPAGATIEGVSSSPATDALEEFDDGADAVITINEQLAKYSPMFATLQVAGTGGTVVLQWAQNAAEVSNLTVKTGSWMTYELLN